MVGLNPCLAMIPNASLVCSRDNLVYSDGHHAIHDFNLDVKAGETVALVGRSGAGKTSLVNLLVRFQEASSGQILFDQIP